MKSVRLVSCLVIYSLSHVNILAFSSLQLDIKDYSSIDPIESLAVIFLTQVRDENYDLKYHEKLRVLIYQSLL